MNDALINSPPRRGAALRYIVATAMFLLALLPAQAAAIPEIEPNDTPLQAQGPLMAPGQIEAMVSDGDPRDFYLVNFPPYTQVSVTLSSNSAVDDNPSGCLEATVRNLLSSVQATTVRNRTTDEESSTSAFTSGQYGLRGIIEVEPCFSDGAEYVLNVGPEASLQALPGQAPVQDYNPEPNETRAQAAGPLAGNVSYVGTIDTANDADWFQLWVPAGQHQISLELMEFTGDTTVRFFVGDATSASLSLSTDDLRWDTKVLTVTGPVVVFAEAKGRAYPAAYALRAEPDFATSLTQDLNVLFPPPPPPPPDTTGPSIGVDRVWRSGSRVKIAWTTNEASTQTSELYRGSKLVSEFTDEIDSPGRWTTTIGLGSKSMRMIRKTRGKRTQFTWRCILRDAAGNWSREVVYRFKL
ncbi:MAG: hypothetical protein JHD16_01310 [Solirubrobacteraceae bacterium]|nr:hypothetical protein [Solirubrobacteraceae bacterium]